MNSIIHKYLEIIKIQNDEIEKLKKDLEYKNNINLDLKRKKKMYKENCSYWKTQHDILKSCVDGIKQKCVNVYEANVIKVYRENQNANR